MAAVAFLGVDGGPGVAFLPDTYGLDFDAITMDMGSRAGSGTDTFGSDALVAFTIEVQLASVTGAAPLFTFTDTTDASGYFARYEHASLSGVPHRITFIRDSDGESGTTLMTPTVLP